MTNNVRAVRNSSWKDWFGAEVGFSIHIHRRGFTSSSTNSNQPSLLHSPKAPARAPWEFAPKRWATPPYRGHKAKFAPCETPPGRTGLVLKLDSLYIYIGGVSPPPPPTATNHRCCLPRRVGASRSHGLRSRGSRPRAPRPPIAPTRSMPTRLAPTRPTPTGLTPRAPRRTDAPALHACAFYDRARYARCAFAPKRWATSRADEARERTTPRERNWSPAPPRRASGQLPHGRTSQPTRQECSGHSSFGCVVVASLPSCVRSGFMPDAPWLLIVWEVTTALTHGHSGRRLHNAVSVGSGVGVAVVRAAFR